MAITHKGAGSVITFGGRGSLFVCSLAGVVVYTPSLGPAEFFSRLFSVILLNPNF